MQEELDVQEELVKLLDYYKEQMKSGGCTMGAMLSLYGFLMENIDVVGTTKDFAEFFGIPESTVRSVIARKMIQKPTRRVFYPFHSFVKIAPRNWFKKK